MGEITEIWSKPCLEYPHGLMRTQTSLHGRHFFRDDINGVYIDTLGEVDEPFDEVRLRHIERVSMVQ